MPVHAAPAANGVRRAVGVGRVTVGASSAIVRDGLLCALARVQRFSVTGCYDNEQALTAGAKAERPDLVLAAFDPLDRMCYIASQLPAPLVAVTWAANEREVVSAFSCGVRAVVSKDAPVAHLVDALDTVRAGMVVYAPGTQPRITRRGEWSRGGDGDALLTNRERQIVQLVVDGLTSRDIASALGIAPQTAKNHLHSVMTKLRVTSRLQLYAWAREHGLTPRIDDADPVTLVG